MRITLLGTGTPKPSAKRVCSGYLIEVGDDVILMDHGAGASQRLAESRYLHTQVTHCFFTHLHYDHFVDYPRLLLQRWDMGAENIPELKVYGPAPLKDATEKLIGRNGAFAADLNARIEHPGSVLIYQLRGGEGKRSWPQPEVTEIADRDTVEGNGWRVTVADVPHAQPYLACFGFRLDSDEGSVCYMGDSGGISKGVVDLARAADVLIHMCYYRTGTEPDPIFREATGAHTDVAEVAKQAGVRTLVLTHMLEHLDVPGVRERTIKEIQDIYDGTVIWGEDLMEIPFEPMPPDPLLGERV